MDYVKLNDISNYQWYRHPNGMPILTDPVEPTKMIGQGTRGVYIRAMTWRGEEDYAFKLNWAMYKGIPRGAYGFTSTDTPVKHAEKFLSIIESTGDPGELPPWLDYEDIKIVPKPPPPDAKETLAWLDLVEKRYRRPMIYTSRYMWFKTAPSWTSQYKLAVANYTAATKTNSTSWLVRLVHVAILCQRGWMGAWSEVKRD